MAILLIVAVVFMFTGFFGYNSLRQKWAGVIGVGGAYIILLGVMLLVMLIGSLVGAILGHSEGSSLVEVLMTIVVMLACMAYMAHVMLARCHTTAQRIMLPIVACMIGFGFCWRVVAAIAFHVPMETGSPETANFPSILYDKDNHRYELLSDSGDHADYYCNGTGQSVQFYASDLEDGLPFGWRRG